MDTVHIKINGFDVPARADASILEASREDRYASRQYDIKIPMLGYLKGVQEADACGLALVEVEGREGLVDASTTQVEDGMAVSTKTAPVVEAQKRRLSEILAIHDLDCRNCVRTGNCELQDLQRHFRLTKTVAEAKRKLEPIDDAGIIVRDPNKCVRCGRCVAACNVIQGVGAIEMVGEGLDGKVVPAGGVPTLAQTKCVNCGQCIVACPTGALRERDDVDAVLAAIANPEKFVVIQTAPSTRVGLAEYFGYPVGSETQGKAVAALRRVGFDRVFDTDFGADLTVMEEAHELVERLGGAGPLPMMTSCCPGWVKFAEHEFADLLPNISSCKSPHQMFGAIVKSYLAEREGIDPTSVVVVSAMPCTAKKFEIGRDDECGAGMSDVDFALTSRETARLIERAGVSFLAMPDEPYDSPLGLGSGAGVIFGATGGVMEAALRTAADWTSGESIADIDYKAVRGIEGVKEAVVEIGGRALSVAAVSGLANARSLMERVRDGSAAYDFIEVMACPGGCVNGGGQPRVRSEVSITCDLRSERARGLYALDGRAEVRKAHDNPDIQTLYESYLGKPGSARSHALLHTSYAAR